jgi:alpha-N-arabinofuranosidase
MSTTLESQVLTRRSFLGGLPAIFALVKVRALLRPFASQGFEYHVSLHGKDDQDGSAARPLRTVAAAAARAHAGDTITVHEGIYRERVAPPRGGVSDTRRIVYQAAPGERVELTGAEIITGWEKVRGDVWRVVIPNTFFGEFNPYRDLIHGDWFDPKGRQHHTGAIYRKGKWLEEAAALSDIFSRTTGIPLWYGQVDSGETTLWAQFGDADPNDGATEMNVRQTVFYPARPGVNYITVRGFIVRRAATPWAPPTAEQIGAIGTHWSKGWIIEENVVSYSICCGIALGKYGDKWDNTSQDSADGYVKTIERALANGWSKREIGHHIVRNNTISHCEQAGIVGSLGAVFSLITHNTIHDIHVSRLFSGFEMAGIKIHAAIDTEISHNYVHHTCLGLWLDWMAQGTRVRDNFFRANAGGDMLAEVDHGPFLVDNNFFLSPVSQTIVSQGGAYVHNLFCGSFSLSQFDGRMTPYMKPHSTEIAGFHNNPSGDIRFYNNIFAQKSDLTRFDHTHLPVELGGNVFLKGAKPCAQEANPLLTPDFDPSINFVNSVLPYFEITLDRGWAADRQRHLVTTQVLGDAMIPKLPFVKPDNSLLVIDKDYAGRVRHRSSPFPGPLEKPEGGRQRVMVGGRKPAL